jgi:hypothetical protein
MDLPKLAVLVSDEWSRLYAPKLTVIQLLCYHSDRG